MSVSRVLVKYQLRRQIKALRSDLYRLAWSWCHDSQLADDLVQDALVRGLERIEQLRDADQLRVWLYRILCNIHRDYLRARKESVASESVALLATADPERELGEQQLVAAVRNAMGSLSDDHRKVITLVDLMECSYAEVADILQLPAGTVMSRLHRARGSLKTLLQAQESESAKPALRRVK